MKSEVEQDRSTPQFLRAVGTFWGVAGFFILLLVAIERLGKQSIGALESGLSPLQWLLLLINVLFMAYSEGYKGFQKGYSPRLAARSKYLLENGNYLQLLLAPLFCMSFFDAPRKRIIVSYCLLIMIVCLVVLFRLLPQPWRGILDAGVVIGLSWGLASTGYFLVKELALQPNSPTDPEVC